MRGSYGFLRFLTNKKSLFALIVTIVLLILFTRNRKSLLHNKRAKVKVIVPPDNTTTLESTGKLTIASVWLHYSLQSNSFIFSAGRFYNLAAELQIARFWSIDWRSDGIVFRGRFGWVHGWSTSIDINSSGLSEEFGDISFSPGKFSILHEENVHTLRMLLWRGAKNRWIWKLW